MKQGTKTALAYIFFAASAIIAPAQASEDIPKDTITQNMARIPAGEFTMGADSLGRDHGAPAHKVYLNEFLIDKHEVTNKQFEEKFPDHIRHKLSAGDDNPVTRVSWFDAIDYCTAVGKSLPTEAQWEKAARGTTKSANDFPWGKEFNAASVHGGLKLRDGTAPVGSYPANEYGLYDMGGNVWEWTNDWADYYPNTDKTIKNPTGPARGHHKIRRGGAWSDEIKGMKTGWRDWSSPDSSFYADVGFRCAYNPPQP